MIKRRSSSIASLLIVIGVGSGFFPALPTPSAQPLTLSASGPWLVYSALDDSETVSSLWAANPDGSAATQLVKDTTIVAMAAAPNGKSVAYISAKYPPDDVEYLQMTLNLLTLPNGKHTVITPLTNATTEPDSGQRDFATQAISISAMQWAPNGQTLAFIGAQGNSTSADLYSYSLATKKITQLSSGDSQAISPNWSPDGKYIVHFGVNNFGSGAGWEMAGAWAAKADGSGIISLFQPKPDDGGFGFIGWTGPNTFITDSGNDQCGNEDLRTFDIATKQITAWYAGPYDSVAWSPTDSALLIYIGTEHASDPNCNGDPPGLYLWTPATAQARLIAPVADDFYYLAWSPVIGRFLVEDDIKDGSSSVISITPDGTIDGTYPTPISPSIAPDGKNIAWISGKTLNVSDAKNFKPVEVSPNVNSVVWLP